MAQPTPPSATTSRLRPFYRLHASTLILLLPFVLLLTILIVPGVIHENNELAIRVEHGWPWMYLRREIVSDSKSKWAFQNAQLTANGLKLPAGGPDVVFLNRLAFDRFGLRPDWFDGWAWWGAAKSSQWRLGPLAADVVVAGFILASIAMLIEWRRRRHARAWQFSLGELACVITLIACALGWWQSNVAAARAEAAIFGKGDSQIVLPESGSKVIVDQSYAGPDWLRHLIGLKQCPMFQRATNLSVDKWTFDKPPAELLPLTCLKSVTIENVHEAESLARWLASMPTIKAVEASPVDHSSVEILSRTGKMTVFDLSGWQLKVEDADLAFLSASPGLRKINLSSSDLTDNGMRHLRKLTDLKELLLLRTNVTDAGVSQLVALTKLERLNLAFTHVTDEGLRYVGTMTQLKDLDLQSAIRITGAGLPHLMQLQNLTKINLGNTHLDETDLVKLKAISSLRELRLTTGQISREAQRSLQAELPNCKIVNSW